MTEHISREIIRLLLEDALAPEDKLDVLEHIASCDACAEIMAELAVEEFAVEPPDDFASRVLNAATPKPEKHESFTLYTLRIVAAVAAALVLLFSGAFNKLGDLNYTVIGEKSAAAAQSVGTAFEKLRNISFDFNLNNETEETDNEQQQK